LDGGGAKVVNHLCPDIQEIEARYVIKRYRSGDDLTDYSYEEKYLGLYTKTDGEWKIHPMLRVSRIYG